MDTGFADDSGGDFPARWSDIPRSVGISAGAPDNHIVHLVAKWDGIPESVPLSRGPFLLDKRVRLARQFLVERGWK